MYKETIRQRKKRERERKKRKKERKKEKRERKRNYFLVEEKKGVRMEYCREWERGCRLQNKIEIEVCMANLV